MDIWRKWRNPRLKPPFGAGIDWSDPITEGLVGCFLFNESFGFPFDNSQARLAQTSGSYKYTPFGLHFDGSSVFVHIDYLNELLGSKYSFVLLINGKVSDDGPSGYGRILISFHTSSYGNVLRFGVDSSKLVVVDAGGSGVNLQSSRNLSDYTETQVALVADTTFKLFIDGDADNSGYTPPSIPDDGFGSIGQEYDSSGPSDFYLGDIAYCYIYNRPLHPEEIERLYYEPYSFFLVPAARIFDLAPSSGTTFQKMVEGALSSSGEASLQFSAGQLLGGSIGPLGSLGWGVSKYTEGELGSSGELRKERQYEFSGALDSSGELSADLSAGNTLSGGVSTSGALELQVSRERAFGGSIEASGTLLLGINKTCRGQVNPNGVALNDRQETELVADKLVGSRQKETLP